MAAARGKYNPPSRVLLGLESLGLVERSVFSLAADRIVPRCANERSPVLVLPGFTASDQSTRPLRGVLRRKGYSVHGWGLGANVGPHPHVLEGMERRLTELFERYGAKVSLVGWSLGGIYARELAHSHPELVRLVITLGSPYRFRLGDRGHTSELYEAVAPQHEPYPGRLLSRGGATTAQGPRDLDLLADRRNRAVAGVHRASRPAAREHRCRRHPQRARLQRRCPVRDHRPPQPATRHVDAVRRTGVPPPDLPAGLTRRELSGDVRAQRSSRRQWFGVGGSPLVGFG